LSLFLSCACFIKLGLISTETIWQEGYKSASSRDVSPFEQPISNIGPGIITGSWLPPII